ncbi:MAG: helix-turn-helix transcriptional regulator [Bacilli bacterium]|nr:helix-turn-helix transcriptional regulator [Bacilli bacterium]
MYTKLKEMRYKKHMTSKEVAEQVGISKAFYCQLENQKRRLLYETAVKIAKVFGVKPDYLFYDETVNKNKKEEEK